VRASELEDSIKNVRKRWDFIFLGRKDKDKGLSELIEATASVRSEWPDVGVLIAGPGDVEEYKNLATSLGLSRNIVFEFFSTEEKTLMALAASRYLVLPSYHEGYPLVILEAADLGVPFIATDVGSVPEMVGTSSAAAIVPARDADSLGAAMLTALSIEEEIYLEKRCAARRLFSSLSGQRKVAQQVADLVRFASMASRPNNGETGL
jgi:glycosyltransferase involved in cell wall biosynthesis